MTPRTQMAHESSKQTTASIIRNVIYGSLSWFVPLGLNLIAVPVIVGSLGHVEYGIYSLVLGFIGYSFTFNFGRAIIKYVAEYRIAGEIDKMNDVISASLLLSLLIGSIGALIMCLMARWLVTDVFMIGDDPERAVIAIYLSAGVIFLTMISQIFNAVLQGVQRFDVYSKILTANSLLLISGNLVLAYLGCGLLALLMWNMSLIVVFCVIYALAAKRLLPGFAIRIGIEREMRALVIRYSAAIVGYQTLANVLLLFERVWITQRLGPESLTFYVVPMSLGIFLHGFISSLLIVLFPLASELTNEPEKLLRLYLKATKVICLIVVFVVLSVVVQGERFLTLWMGELFARESSSLLVIHIITFGLISIMAVSWQMTEGLGRPRVIAAATGICSAIGIVLLIALVDSSGNKGAALARLSAFAIVFLAVFFIERMFFGKVQTRFWRGLIGNLAAAGIFAAIIEYSVMSSLPVKWVTLVLSSLLGALAYGFVLWLLDFVSADEKLLVRQVFNRQYRKV